MCALSLHQAMITAPRTLPHPPLRGMLGPTSTPLAVLRATDSAERLSYPGRWSPIRQDHRRRADRGLGPGRTRPLPGRTQGRRHQHPTQAMTDQQVVAAHHVLHSSSCLAAYGGTSRRCRLDKNQPVTKSGRYQLRQLMPTCFRRRMIIGNDDDRWATDTDPTQHDQARISSTRVVCPQADGADPGRYQTHQGGPRLPHTTGVIHHRRPRRTATASHHEVRSAEAGGPGGPPRRGGSPTACDRHF